MPSPGVGRITLALLAVVPAAMGYPWQSTRSQWVLGVAVLVVIGLFGWRRGLYFTTMVRRRLAMGVRGGRPVPEPRADDRTTALLRIGPGPSDSEALPLPLIAGYLDRYGIRADTVRITNRNDASGGRQTWVGLTVCAVDNLAALRARSARIPLAETAEAAARRLADQLSELGWDAAAAAPGDVPELLAVGPSDSARETWRAVRLGDSECLAAYRIAVDSGLSGALEGVWSVPVDETWTALEIGWGDAGEPYTVAAACAFHGQSAPDAFDVAAPAPGLTPEYGNQRRALSALDPLSSQRLGRHTDAPADLLATLAWPTPVAGAHRAAEEAVT
ncbi:type VII secretion protein EccE [Mycobacterium sp.]|uniref:type VII secretion protein EccE n=1 Tax=Mycobacterium sp. TaxID=1785 RepID=UPI003A87CCBA